MMSFKKTTTALLPTVLLLGSLALALPGCNTDTLLSPEKLAPPLGLSSITGTGSVTLTWQASNYGEDRNGFKVYQAPGALAGNAPNGIPSAFGTTPVATLNTTTEAGEFSQVISGLTNGTTYSFLVVAYKNDGTNLSDQSNPSNVITDTPRSESNGVLNLFNGSGNARYLDVAAPTPTATLTNAIDIECQSFNAGAGDRPGIVGRNGARVQDLGFVNTWDEVDNAPLGSGSYPISTFSVQALNGHAYAVFTGDGHYAKLWVTSVDDPNLDFSCRVAYQPQQGNNELAPGRPGN